jgi:Mg-chelatase subunit ChlD
MSKSIVQGSLAAVAKQEGQSLAESFLSADAVIIVDTSGSMDARDVPGKADQSRYRVACDELARLQAELPGKVAVVAFSSTVQFVWGGQPPFLNGGTDMAEALRFVKPADGCGMRLVLISDGEPNDPDATMQVAKGFASPIDCVFVGPPGSRGANFLKQLSAATGGTHHTRTIPQLAETVRGLLAAGK